MMGWGWATMAAFAGKDGGSIPNFSPVWARNILDVGGRDFYPEERALFEQSGGTIVGSDAIKQLGVREALQPKLNALGNEVAAPDGFTVSQVEEIISMVGERFTVCASDPRY